VFTGLDIGDWVYCPKRDNKRTSITGLCGGCSCYEAHVREDPSNPFNYNTEVLCTFEEEGVSE